MSLRGVNQHASICGGLPSAPQRKEPQKPKCDDGNQLEWLESTGGDTETHQTHPKLSVSIAVISVSVSLFWGRGDDSR